MTGLQKLILLGLDCAKQRNLSPAEQADLLSEAAKHLPAPFDELCASAATALILAEQHQMQLRLLLERSETR